MTLDEAKKIAEIAMEADGGCYVCVEAQFELLREAFPEFTWAYHRVLFSPVYVPAYFTVGRA